MVGKKNLKFCKERFSLPVGLLGEQKKMMSVLGEAKRSGKKSLSGEHLR